MPRTLLMQAVPPLQVMQLQQSLTAESIVGKLLIKTWSDASRNGKMPDAKPLRLPTAPS
jgi:hypothetical protein